MYIYIHAKMYIIFSQMVVGCGCRIGTNTHACVTFRWHDLFLWVTWCVMRDMVYSYVPLDSFIRVASLIHMYEMTYAWHGPGTGRVTNSPDSIINFRPAPKMLCCLWTSALVSFYFFIFYFFHSWQFWCQAFFVYFEFSRLPHIERCVDHCLWSTTGHFVKFVNRIRRNTL